MFIFSFAATWHYFITLSSALVVPSELPEEGVIRLLNRQRVYVLLPLFIVFVVAFKTLLGHLNSSIESGKGASTPQSLLRRVRDFLFLALKGGGTSTLKTPQVRPPDTKLKLHNWHQVFNVYVSVLCMSVRLSVCLWWTPSDHQAMLCDTKLTPEWNRYKVC